MMFHFIAFVMFFSQVGAINIVQPAIEQGLTYYGFHIHVYFHANNKKSVEQALLMRQSLMDLIDFDHSVVCTNEVNDKNCLWSCYDDSPACLNMEPRGPHPVGSWGAFIEDTTYYSTIIPWINNKAYEYQEIPSILIHPLTAKPNEDTPETNVRDHRLGLWFKTIMPLDFDAFYN